MRALLLAPLLLAACGGGGDAVIPDAGFEDSGPPPDSGYYPGQVLLSTVTLDLGAIVLGTSNSGSFTITNPGTESVKIALAQASGPDAERFVRSVNVPETAGSFKLEAGGVATVTVSGTPEAEGPIGAAIQIDSCETGCPQTVMLAGEGVLSGVRCPERLDLGLVNPGNCVMRTLTCTNAGNATERITAVELEPTSDPEITLARPALPIVLAARGRLNLDVAYCPESPAEHQGEITIATFTPFQTERSIRLTGRGGGADISCEPTELDFGAVGVGASVTGQVLCHNRGFDPGELDVSLAGGTEFSIDAVGSQLGVGETVALTVTHAPASPGPKQDTLRIATNDPDAPEIDVPLRSTALMVNPCAAVLEPTSFDLGLVGLGDARVARFYVKNTGDAACLVRDVHLTLGSGTDFQVVEPPPPGVTIDPGSARAIDVQLAPQSNGAVNARLVVAFSNPGTTELTGDLNAVAGVTPIAIDPPVIDFGPTPLGCAAPHTLTVQLRRIAGGTGSVLNVQVANDATGVFSVAASVPQTLAFWDTTELSVSYDPQVAGRDSAQLRIITDASPTAIIVPITGEAVAAGPQHDLAVMSPRAVDLLFVIDDACSMRPAQTALAAAIGELDRIRLDRQADVHAAVITTDMENTDRSGHFQGIPPVLDGASPSFRSALESRVAVGIGGSSNEMGVLALYTALTPPLSNAGNAGFLRADADLAIIAVSDENDYSPPTPAIPPVVAALRQAAGRGRLLVAGMVGLPNRSCSGPYGTASAASRWFELSGRTQTDVPTSICNTMQANLRALGERLFGVPAVSLSGRPLIGTIAVTVDGAPLPASAWRYDLSTNRVVILDPADAPIGAGVEVTYDPVCLSATCGDGATDPGEECDDSNTNGDDSCVDCAQAVCGDGIVEVGVEACDDGNLIESDACLPGCSEATCGDGVLRLGVETCDDGNTVSGDGCPATCRYYTVSGPDPQPFVPITGGTPLTPAYPGQDPNDDGVATVTLPFELRLFDVPTATLTVSVNGFASTSPGIAPNNWVNTFFPNTALPDGVMAPWWDDLYLDTAIPGGAEIAWTVTGTTPARVVVIEWRDVRLQGQSTANHRRFTFQLQLEESGVIRFAYGDTETAGTVPTVASASAGLEDPSAQRGLEVLGCSPNCDGRARPPRADGFPVQSVVTFTP